MKHAVYLVALLPAGAWSVSIPLQGFDAQKLETLLRGIPSAYVKSDMTDNMERKYFAWPKDPSNFSIKCQADHYNGSPIPSAKTCYLDADDSKAKGDQILTQIKDPEMVGELRKAISYEEKIKKFYSHQRVYGQGTDGYYRYLFRYQLDCAQTSCTFSVSPKVAPGVTTPTEREKEPKDQTGPTL